jgi:hypothetical protein
LAIATAAQPARIDGRLLVGRLELRAVGLLGQVQVPPRLAADQHRDAEERRHRRMPGGEPVGARMGADVGQPQRPGVGDQHAEHAATARKVADRPRGWRRRCPAVRKRSSSLRSASSTPSAA